MCVIGYRVSSLHEKSYCVSANMVAGEFPRTELNPQAGRDHILVSTDSFVVSQLICEARNVCVCVCVCVKERERESVRLIWHIHFRGLFDAKANLIQEQC